VYLCLKSIKGWNSNWKWSKTAPGGKDIVINIKDNKLEKMIEEILKRTPFSSSLEYLEDRIRRDHALVVKNKKIGWLIWLPSRSSDRKQTKSFSSFTKKVLSTSIEPIPTLYSLVESRVLKQQKQEQTKSVKPRTWSGIRSNSNLSVVYKALQGVPRLLRIETPSLASAAERRPSPTPMESDIQSSIPRTTTPQREVDSEGIQTPTAIITISTNLCKWGWRVLFALERKNASRDISLKPIKEETGWSFAGSMV
jgi:hypothetical protein